MAIIRNLFWIAFFLFPDIASACPSCAMSSNQRFFDQTLVSVAVMWLLPMVVAVFLGFKIYYICNSDTQNSPQEK